MRSQRKWLCLFLLCLLACGRTVALPTPTPIPSQPAAAPIISSTPTLTIPTPPSPTPTATATTVPTPTPTPVGTTWTVGPVLIQFSHTTPPSGFGLRPPPNFVLYSDGQLVITDVAPHQLPYGPLLTTALSRQEMCALLNSITTTGFLDMPRADYIAVLPNEYLGPTDTLIEINGPRPRQDHFPSLNVAISRSDITIPSPLVQVYELLSHYRPAALQPYPPTPLLVYLLGFPTHGTSSEQQVAWPLTTPTLPDLLTQVSYTSHLGSHGVLLEGDAAATFYTTFDEAKLTGRPLFVHEDLVYTVSMRPLLPFETAANIVDSDFYTLPSPDLDVLERELTCFESDGLVKQP